MSERFRPAVCWMACALLLGAASHVARGSAGVERVQLRPGPVKNLRPGTLLVASRDLPDPNFTDSVVVLAQFSDKEGAMGLIVNRQTSVPLTRVVPDLKTHGEVSVFLGGPVSADSVLVLARSTQPIADSQHVVADLYLVTSRETLEAQLQSGGRERVRVYLGYCGWAPGQLERETIDGGWHVLPPDPSVVFDADPDSVWERELKKSEGLMARLPFLTRPVVSLAN
jgi:putative transcriptional regulator